MTGVNKLKTKVLITVDEIIFHAPVDHNVDPRTLFQNIIIAEKRLIKPLLGATVYAGLVNNKNLLVEESNISDLQTFVNTGRPSDRETITLQLGDYVNSDTFLTAPQLTLWQDHLHKIVAETVYFVSLPTNRIRFTSQGVMKNNPDSIASTHESVSISLNELKNMMDRVMRDRISPLMDDMHLHLCATGYSGYSRDCGCNQVQTKKTGFVFGMYDDDDCGCGSSVSSPAYVSTSAAVTNAAGQNEVITFEDVDTLVIPWTAARKQRFGKGGKFSWEIIQEDGSIGPEFITAVPDSITNTTMYTASLGGIKTGRVIIG